MAGRSNTLSAFVLRRCMAAIPLVLSVITINFLLIHLAPGDPISLMVGEHAPSEQQMRALHAAMGIDQPLYVQYLKYMGTLLQGDLGFSYVAQTPVLDLILGRLGATGVLMLSSLIVFTALGIAVGVFVARRPYSATDNVSSFVAVIGYSVPVFWLGQIGLLVFGLQLNWLPVQGMVNLRADPQGWDYVQDVALHLILPASVLGARYLAINTRLTRASMIEALNQDYVVAARAKGLSEGTVGYHAFRNAIIPVVTIFGMNFGEILAGSVLIEIVFGWPGLGRLMYDGVFSRDYPLLMGMFIFISFGVILANLLADLAYGFLDPRVRQT
jgi:ABC-type dipeptide/oligopeptide/nickel transport system permease component